MMPDWSVAMPVSVCCLDIDEASTIAVLQPAIGTVIASTLYGD